MWGFLLMGMVLEFLSLSGACNPINDDLRGDKREWDIVEAPFLFTCLILS